MALPDAVLFDASTLLIAYFGIGCLFYRLVEGWQIIDSVYFMIVTSTTVGYGDFTPLSALGRLFTCVYALVGTVLLWKTSAPTVAGVVEVVKTLPPLAPKHPLAAADHRAISLEESRERINDAAGYARACLSPLVFVAVGAVGYYYLLVEVDNPVDSIYVTVISMLTIGFGDLHPVSREAKIAACVFLPIASAAVGEMAEEWLRISSRRRIRDTDHEKLVDEVLLQEAASK